MNVKRLSCYVWFEPVSHSWLFFSYLLICRKLWNKTYTGTIFSSRNTPLLEYWQSQFLKCSCSTSTPETHIHIYRGLATTLPEPISYRDAQVCATRHYHYTYLRWSYCCMNCPNAGVTPRVSAQFFRCWIETRCVEFHPFPPRPIVPDPNRFRESTALPRVGN